jgi:integrase
MVVVQTVDVGRRHLVWRWTCPQTGKLKQRSAGTGDRAEAVKRSGQLEAELSGRAMPTPSGANDWERCRDLYEAQHVGNLRPNTRSRIATALDHFAEIVRPVGMERINGRDIIEFRNQLRTKGLAHATAATIVRHVKAFFRWCRDEAEIVQRIPKFPRGESRNQGPKMKGQPITEDEFRRMLKAVKQIRPHDAAEWRRYLRGLWLSGLRLRESIDLSWDGSTPIVVRKIDGAWVLEIVAGYQKNGKASTTPITPDFAKLLDQTKPSDRKGRVFRLTNEKGAVFNHYWVSETIIRIAAAGSVMREKGNAGAHDFRRSFCTRWAMRVPAATLQALARHGSIQTTLSYYVKYNAREMSLTLKKQFSSLAD